MLPEQQGNGQSHPGKQADLLVLSVADYRHLGYRFGTNLVAQVMKRGVWLTADFRQPRKGA